MATQRRRLAKADKPTLGRALSDDDPAVLAAALEASEKQGLKIKEDRLADLLRRAPNQAMALPAARMLAARATPSARAALRDHLGRGGPASDVAAMALAKTDPDAHDELLDRAANGGTDDATVAAVKALAHVPGPRAERLLERLSRDWSDRLQEAAAWAKRERARPAANSEAVLAED